MLRKALMVYLMLVYCLSLSSKAYGTTKYPILLLHGVAAKSEVLGAHYFGRLPKALKSKGYEVFDGNHLAWGSFDQNANILYEDINYKTEELGYEKVNIISHSKGGLDARYMLWKYSPVGISNRVASLTTLNTPHRGSVTADSLFAVVPDSLHWIPVMITNVIAAFQGEWNTDSLAVYQSMRTEDMAFLNAIIGDPSEGCAYEVYCQSYSSIVTESIADKFSQTLAWLNKQLGKPVNDGLVAGEHSQFGHFRGLVKPDQGDSISHLGIIDRGRIISHGGTPGFDPISFYHDILLDLEEKGF